MKFARAEWVGARKGWWPRLLSANERTGMQFMNAKEGLLSGVEVVVKGYGARRPSQSIPRGSDGPRKAEEIVPNSLIF